MRKEEFDIIINQFIKKVLAVLNNKQKIYVKDEIDVLNNFKKAGKIQNCSPKESLGGMMAKHTISIYNMINSTSKFTEEEWHEKIIDHINYLLFLVALLEEEKKEERVKAYEYKNNN